jgi:hypothetical protein
MILDPQILVTRLKRRKRRRVFHLTVVPVNQISPKTFNHFHQTLAHTLGLKIPKLISLFWMKRDKRLLNRRDKKSLRKRPKNKKSLI